MPPSPAAPSATRCPGAARTPRCRLHTHSPPRPPLRWPPEGPTGCDTPDPAADPAPDPAGLTRRRRRSRRRPEPEEPARHRERAGPRCPPRPGPGDPEVPRMSGLPGTEGLSAPLLGRGGGRALGPRPWSCPDPHPGRICILIKSSPEERSGDGAVL